MIYLMTGNGNNGFMFLIIIMNLAIYSPAIALFIWSGICWRKNTRRAKVLLLIGGAYVLVGLGVCANMIY